MLERGLRGIAVAGLLFVALACGKSTHEPLGTNTNWLASCEADDDCRGGNQCLCGVCTRVCSAAEQCAPLADRADCTPVTAACGADANEPASQSACLLGCSGDGDCSAVANGECRNGVCLPRIATGGRAGTGAPRPDAAVPLPDASTPAVDGGGAPIDPYALVRNESAVEIGAAYLDCDVDEDCTLVGTGCDGCCQYGAIEKALQSTYDVNFAKACADYRGGFCSCSPVPAIAKCVAGTCRVAAECVSPTQNSQRAYDVGAMGCPCDQPDDAICIGRVGLVCGQSGGGFAWLPVEDGPCEPQRPEACVPGRTRGDPGACLDAYKTCREMTNGQFCGEGCHEPLDCTEWVCAPYSPLTNPQCIDDLELFEGLCDGGKLRYRADAGGYGGSTRYWDATTGALLAVHTWTDTGSYCDGTSFDADLGDETAIMRCQADENTREPLCPQ